MSSHIAMEYYVVQRRRAYRPHPNSPEWDDTLHQSFNEDDLGYLNTVADSLSDAIGEDNVRIVHRVTTVSEEVVR